MGDGLFDFTLADWITLALATVLVGLLVVLMIGGGDEW